MSAREPTLVVIDVQRAFDDPGWGERNNPDAEAKVAELLAGWRAAGAPLVHVRHESRRFSGEPFDYKDEARPQDGEAEIVKHVHSAFIGTDLEERLRALGTETVVIAGLTTDHCCSTTARMAMNLGFEVWFVSDATATFAREGPSGRVFDAETMHESALASLNGEFAQVIDTAAVLQRMALRT
jgi:nicotinamidase-related amidase